MSSELIGIIPAAGQGSRMGELSKDLPKALIEIEGTTLLERAVDSLKCLGVSRIIVVVGHLDQRIREYVGSHDWGVEISFAFQERQLGLANAIASAANEITDDFVVLCPDNVYTNTADLPCALQLFQKHQPAFLLVATATPSQQRDRRSYITAARRNIETNLFDYRETKTAHDGLEISSTGCVFFKTHALRFMPSFVDVTVEHKFRDYLETIAAREESLIYLLRGMRYDFSEPDDIEDYVNLRARLSDTVGQGVSAILINNGGQVLLQQRDDNPAIRYPSHWALFGGTIEPGESPTDAVVREVQEEIAYELRNFGLFREFVQNNKREFAFAGEITADLSELTLSEGQGMAFFTKAQLKTLLIRPDDKETLKTFLGDWLND